MIYMILLPIAAVAMFALATWLAIWVEYRLYKKANK